MFRRVLQGKINPLMTGKEFNKRYGHKKFYKLTTASENHNGLQFKTGLNIDVHKFNPENECEGGIYFSETRKIGLWYNSTGELCVYYREVTVPDDAMVYIEHNKVKANKLILSERKSLWKDSYMCKHILLCSGVAIKYIETQTEELCNLAVKESYTALEHIKNPTQKQYEIAKSTKIRKEDKYLINREREQAMETVYFSC